MGCKRRRIHAQIFNSEGMKISEAENGPFEGDCHCPGADVPPGEGGPDTLCFGIHAEIQALLKIPKRARHDARRLHSTKAPCSACVRILLGTRIESITFDIPSNEKANEVLWQSYGRTWEKAK